MTSKACDNIIASLFGDGVSSYNRLEELIKMLPDPLLSPKDFFHLMFEIWPSCDDTFLYNATIHRELLDNRALEPAHSYKDEATSAFYASIPEHFTAYRGCTRLRAKGISWTLDRKVAEGFARGYRCYTVPDPVIASVTASKDEILLAIADRQESEVLLDVRDKEMSIETYVEEASVPA